MNSKPHLNSHCILGSGPLNPGLAFMLIFMAYSWEKLVDAHSKWLEAVVVSSTSSQHAILHMLRCITSAPYHPTTNGLAEQAMQTVKNALRKTSGDIDALFLYRIIPPLTLPQENLLLSCSWGGTQSPLDFTFPSMEQHATQNKERQKENHDKHIRLCSFQVGEEVYALNHRRAPNWISGKVTAVLDPLTDIIRFNDGTETHYHVDHVKARIQGGERESEKFRQPELDSFLPL